MRLIKLLILIGSLILVMPEAMAIDVALKSRVGTVEGESYPMTNHNEASGTSYSFIPQVNLKVSKSIYGGLILPFGYHVVDLPAGGAVNHWLKGNVTAFAAKNDLVVNGVGVNYGLGLSLPTAEGDSDPANLVFINKAQTISSAISGHANRELYEPERTGLIPFASVSHEVLNNLDVTFFAKLPILALIGTNPESSDENTTVNSFAVHSSIGADASLSFFGWLSLDLKSRYSRFLRSTVEGSQNSVRPALTIEPEIGIGFAGWEVDLGYTKSLSQVSQNEMNSFYLNIAWQLDKPKPSMPVN